MSQKQIPFKSVCDLIFKQDLLPAVYRWISCLSPEELVRFGSVFPRIAEAMKSDSPKPSVQTTESQIQAPRYTVPEWRLFTGGEQTSRKELSPESLVTRATSSHLTYGAFDEEQARSCRAVPTRTRESDKSQITTIERSPAYMDRWADRMLNTTYRNDICHSKVQRTLKDQTPDQTIIVYSKGTLNEAASIQAKQFIDVDTIWTRNFRELCRSLANAIDATTYRGSFTSIKKSTGERFVHPKWTDPIPVSRGLEKPAESYWQSTNRGDFVPMKRADETFKVANQHKASYPRPFDLHPMTEKNSTTVRDGYQDHMANKDDHPDYWNDHRVRMPPGSGVVGNILGAGPKP